MNNIPLFFHNSRIILINNKIHTICAIVQQSKEDANSTLYTPTDFSFAQIEKRLTK